MHQTSRANLKHDDVEGIKNFDRAYDKLVKKFYHEEGANLLIPQEDLIMHEYNMQNKVKVDVEDHQRRIREQQRKKDEKIRLAQLEKEQKELEECSFAPNVKAKKAKKRSVNKN